MNIKLEQANLKRFLLEPIIKWNPGTFRAMWLNLLTISDRRSTERDLF